MQTRFSDTVEETDRTCGAHLEVDIELPDDLCSGRTVNGHGFDGQTRTIEGELCRREGCDHGGKGDD